MGRKITLEQARQQGEDTLLIYCDRHRCHHSGEMGPLHALVLWGPERRLDELPLICSACGSRDVNVRPYHRVGPGGMPLKSNRDVQ